MNWNLFALTCLFIFCNYLAKIWIWKGSGVVPVVWWRLVHNVMSFHEMKSCPFDWLLLLIIAVWVKWKEWMITSINYIGSCNDLHFGIAVGLLIILIRAHWIHMLHIFRYILVWLSILIIPPGPAGAGLLLWHFWLSMRHYEHYSIRNEKDGSFQNQNPIHSLEPGPKPGSLHTVGSWNWNHWKGMKMSIQN